MRCLHSLNPNQSMGPDPPRVVLPSMPDGMLQIRREGDEGSIRSALLTGLPPIACIVGAPRCGTTSLAGMLKGQPIVCLSKVKEPHFFSRFDLNGLDDEELSAVAADQY